MKQIAKALLILILSVWASAGNNLLSASNSPRSSAIKRVEVFQHRPHHERPQFKNPIMNDKDFQYLYKVIKKKAFEKDQLELLSVGVLDNYFSCRQCAKIMSIYSFDKDKLKVLDIMAKHIVDKENARLILDSFRFESDRRKAASKLGIREKRK
jgi:hypothetical protein